MRTAVRSIAAAFVLSLLSTAASAADCIAIIGTGRVGSALGARFATLGHDVVFGSRTPDGDRARTLVAGAPSNARVALPKDAASACGIVVLAVPWDAAESSLQSLGDLRGKILVDVTNPMAVHDHREWPIAVPDSGGERVQAWAAGAKVVKALNTLNFKVMADPGIAGGPVTVPICGDDAGAKAQVSALVRELGLEPLDVGPLRIARYTESLALLYASRLQSGEPMLFEYYLRLRAR